MSSKCRIKISKIWYCLRPFTGQGMKLLQANGLYGYSKKRLQAKEDKNMEADCGNSVCRQSGKPIERQTTGRKRIYYSR